VSGFGTTTGKSRGQKPKQVRNVEWRRPTSEPDHMKQTADAMKEKAVAVAGMTWKRVRLWSAIMINESKHGRANRLRGRIFLSFDCEEESRRAWTR
jgi:hypothetical protein